MGFQRLVSLIFLASSILISVIVVPAHIVPTPHLQELMDAFGQRCNGVCWHGIELGRSTVTEAKTLLSTDPQITLSGIVASGCPIQVDMRVEQATWEGSICVEANGRLLNLVKWIDLSLTGNLSTADFTLFDAIQIWGPPVAADCEIFYSLRLGSTYSARVTFKNGIQVGAEHDLPYNGTLFDPILPIRWIRFTLTTPTQGAIQKPWHGFTSQRFNSNGTNPCGTIFE